MARDPENSAPTLEESMDVIVHSRIVVTRGSFERVIEEMQNAEPTQALRLLMLDGDQAT